MATEIKTILFDFDGTLLDTNDLILSTFEYVLNHYQLGNYTKEDCIPFIGPPLEETFGSIDPTRTAELIDAYRTWNIDRHDDYVKPFPQVDEVLCELKRLGIQLAIVSTKRRDVVELGLQHFKAKDVFETIVCFEDVSRLKPDPEPIHLAMNRLNAQPETTVMVGDNSHDIEGAHNAGVRSVAVAWSLKGEAFLQQFNPTYTVHQMTDFLTLVKEGKL